MVNGFYKCENRISEWSLVSQRQGGRWQNPGVPVAGAVLCREHAASWLPARGLRGAGRQPGLPC